MGNPPENSLLICMAGMIFVCIGCFFFYCDLNRDGRERGWVRCASLLPGLVFLLMGFFAFYKLPPGFFGGAQASEGAGEESRRRLETWSKPSGPHKYLEVDNDIQKPPTTESESSRPLIVYLLVLSKEDFIEFMKKNSGERDPTLPVKDLPDLLAPGKPTKADTDSLTSLGPARRSMSSNPTP